jgi:hypothetical protein
MIISNTRKKRVVYNEVIAGSTFQSIFFIADPGLTINYYRPEPVGIFRDSPTTVSCLLFLHQFPRNGHSF